MSDLKSKVYSKPSELLRDIAERVVVESASNSYLTDSAPVFISVFKAVEETPLAGLYETAQLSVGQFRKVDKELRELDPAATIPNEYSIGLLNRLGQKLDECFGYGDEDIESLLDEWREFDLSTVVLAPIPMPTNKEQARAMALTGWAWLRDNAPEELNELYPTTSLIPDILELVRENDPHGCGLDEDEFVEKLKKLAAESPICVGTKTMPEGWRSQVEKALSLAKVFDDGSDGADGESAASVVSILSALLSTPAEATTYGVFSPCDRYKVPNLKDGQTVVCLEGGEQRRIEFCQAEDGEYWWRDSEGKLAAPSHYSLWGMPFADAVVSNPAAPQADEWAPYYEYPEIGKPVLGYHPDWVDEDFCPDGVRECFTFGDGTEWQSARWDGYSELWVVEDGAPTLWIKHPQPPEQEGQ